ncbi:MAG: VOC family protein [Ostreibacterium sp.]
MKYLHTMIRIHSIDKSLAFYCSGLGMVEHQRIDNEQGQFTLIFLAAPDDLPITDASPLLELTYNWGSEEVYQGGRNFGHLAFRVDNIYEYCQNLLDKGIIINRPPRDGHMAFIRSPDGVSIELLQKGERLSAADPWQNLPNIGNW